MVTLLNTISRCNSLFCSTYFYAVAVQAAQFEVIRGSDGETVDVGGFQQQYEASQPEWEEYVDIVEKNRQLLLHICFKTETRILFHWGVVRDTSSLTGLQEAPASK